MNINDFLAHPFPPYVPVLICHADLILQLIWDRKKPVFYPSGRGTRIKSGRYPPASFPASLGVGLIKGKEIK